MDARTIGVAEANRSIGSGYHGMASGTRMRTSRTSRNEYRKCGMSDVSGKGGRSGWGEARSGSVGGSAGDIDR
ncbi:hypothetical protein JCM24511_04068 [Saitozyma sp. JCM 24511]|nr:hypothetical protein JCM24511_04068 [Saitozyma sp. JCM 24511]